jgi:hypothetical protein
MTAIVAQQFGRGRRCSQFNHLRYFFGFGNQNLITKSHDTSLRHYSTITTIILIFRTLNKFVFRKILFNKVSVGAFNTSELMIHRDRLHHTLHSSVLATGATKVSPE